MLEQNRDKYESQSINLLARRNANYRVFISSSISQCKIICNIKSYSKRKKRKNKSEKKGKEKRKEKKEGRIGREGERKESYLK